MFRSRWRGGGGKAKAVFKLQFHATQARLRLPPSLWPEAELLLVFFIDA